MDGINTFRVERLEREKDELLHERAATNKKLSSLQQELQNVKSHDESQIQRLVDRCNAMQEKVKKLSRIETSIVDLHLEINDRSGGDANIETNSNETIAREYKGDSYLKISSQDSLVVLEQLRASLRIQLAFKEDYEKELKHSLSRKNLIDRENTLKLNGLAQNLKQKCAILEQERNEAIERMEFVQASKDCLIKASHEAMKKLRETLQSESMVVGEKNEEIEVLNQRLIEMREEARQGKRDAERIADLERKLQTERVKGEETRQKLLHLQSVITQDEEKREKIQIGTLMSDKQLLVDKVKVLESQVAGFHHNARLLNLDKAQKAEKRATRNAEALRNRLEDTNKHLKFAQSTVDRQKKELSTLKEEYDEVLSSLHQSQHLKRSTNLEKSSSEATLHGTNRFLKPTNATASRLANENTNVAQFYKKKLLKSEEEVAKFKETNRQLVISLRQQSPSRFSWSKEPFQQQMSDCEARDYETRDYDEEVLDSKYDEERTIDECTTRNAHQVCETNGQISGSIVNDIRTLKSKNQTAPEIETEHSPEPASSLREYNEVLSNKKLRPLSAVLPSRQSGLDMSNMHDSESGTRLENSGFGVCSVLRTGRNSSSYVKRSCKLGHTSPMKKSRPHSAAAIRSKKLSSKCKPKAVGSSKCSVKVGSLL